MQAPALCALLLMAGAVCADHAGSAPAYPERPIKLIVHTTAGSSSDTTARLVAQEMGRRLGQQMVVDNRSGAGGSIGAEAAAKAPADGYTLLVGASSVMVMLPAVSRRKLPYDADFVSNERPLAPRAQGANHSHSPLWRGFATQRSGMPAASNAARFMKPDTRKPLEPKDAR